MEKTKKRIWKDIQGRELSPSVSDVLTKMKEALQAESDKTL